MCFLRTLYCGIIPRLRGQRYECEKKIVSNEKVVNQYSKVVRCQNGIQPPSEKEKRNPTASRLADEYGVGTRSIIRDAQFAKVVDILPKDKRNEVLNGGERISLNDADTILKFPKPIQTKFIKEVEKGTPIKEGGGCAIVVRIDKNKIQKADI